MICKTDQLDLASYKAHLHQGRSQGQIRNTSQYVPLFIHFQIGGHRSIGTPVVAMERGNALHDAKTQGGWVNNNGRRTARRRNEISNARRNTCFDRQISARTVTFSTFISLDPMSQRDHRALPQFPGRATHEGDLMHCGFVIRQNDFRKSSYQAFHIRKPSGTSLAVLLTLSAAIAPATGRGVRTLSRGMWRLKGTLFFRCRYNFPLECIKF
jgi:hypothetical protein